MSTEEVWQTKEGPCPKCGAPCEIYYYQSQKKMECLECGYKEGTDA